MEYSILNKNNIFFSNVLLINTTNITPLKLALYKPYLINVEKSNCILKWN